MNFSVLLSVYFKEVPGYLDLCLNSINSQKVRPQEVVLVFDGALTDELELVVANWEDKLPMKIVRLDHNVGLGKALNAGIQACSNEWVLRMDTDDVCADDRFEKQVEFIVKNPGVDLFGSSIIEYDADMRNCLGRRVVPVRYQEITDFAKSKNPFNHMTVAYKKSKVMAAGGYVHHHFMEDYNLWLRMIASGCNVGNLDEDLVHVRAGEGMIRRRRGFDYVRSEYDLFRLKRDLGITGFWDGAVIFVGRSLMRLLPTSVLASFYRFMRG